MNRQLLKGFQALKTVFKEGDMVRHIYKNNVRVGMIDKEGYLVSNDLSFTSLSTFAEYHKFNLVGRPITTNGWTECEWRNPDTSWQSTYTKRKV